MERFFGALTRDFARAKYLAHFWHVLRVPSIVAAALYCYNIAFRIIMAS